MGIKVDKKSDKKASKPSKADKKADNKAAKLVAVKPVSAKDILAKAAVSLTFFCGYKIPIVYNVLLMQKKAKTAVKPTPKADSSDSSDSDESEEKPAPKANGKVLLILAALPCCLYFLTHPEESKGHCQADTKS
jgi:hypothetical protein